MNETEDGELKKVGQLVDWKERKRQENGGDYDIFRVRKEEIVGRRK